MSKLRWAGEFFAIRRAIAALLAMVMLVGLGERMAERFLPLYITALGGGALAVSFLAGMDDLLSALYSYPGAFLSQRLGTKRALLIFNLMAMAGFVVAIVAPVWQVLILAAALFIAWTAISLPATMELVARVLPKGKRTMGVSVHSFVRRIPMALGPVIGGAFMAVWGVVDGIRLAFGLSLLLALVAIVLQQRLIDDDRPLKMGKGGPAGGEAAPAFGPGLVQLLVADILVRFCERIPYAFVVIWCTEHLGGPAVGAAWFGVLTAIEMATAMAIYVPVAYFADRGRKKPFVVATFGFFTLFPLVLLFSTSWLLMVVAFVIRGLKEFGEPTRKALIMDLAPEGRKAAAFGRYYLIRDVIVSAAAFGGGLLWQVDPAVNFVVAAGFGVAGTVYFAWRGRDLGGSESAQAARATSR